jgi:hypothetical protein
MSLGSQERAELGNRGRAYYREHFARRAALDRVESTLQRAVDTLQLGTGAAHVQR